MKALQDQQRQERISIQTRQQEERQKQAADQK
jgi:hypothetical protein